MAVQDGQLVKYQNGPERFLIMNGRRAYIANDDVLSRLYDGTPEVVEMSQDEIDSIEGAPEMGDAYLAQSDSEDKTYLVANGSKHFISSGEALAKYHFAKNKAQNKSQAELDAIPDESVLS